MIQEKRILLRPKSVHKYFRSLINKFYKILPIKESAEPSLTEYMISLQRELLGFESLIEFVGDDAMYTSLVSILEYLIHNECSVSVVKTEVFKAINLCNKLIKVYCADNSLL